MKKIIHVNILLWMLICAPQLMLSQAAAIPNEAAYQKLEQQFEAPQVSSEQLFLFEKKGIEHLKDFMNVVGMLSANDVDPKFRRRLEIAAIDYFSNSTDSILLFKGNKSDVISIETFIKNLKKENSKFQEINLSKFRSTTPVFVAKKYTWKVSFLFSQKEKEDKNMSAIFILNKEKKKFGSVEKEVWEVLLKRIVEEK